MTDNDKMHALVAAINQKAEDLGLETYKCETKTDTSMATYTSFVIEVCLVPSELMSKKRNRENTL